MITAFIIYVTYKMSLIITYQLFKTFSTYWVAGPPEVNALNQKRKYLLFFKPMLIINYRIHLYASNI